MDQCRRGLAPLFVGNADDDGLANLWVFLKSAFDLDGLNIGAAGDDRLARAADDEDAPLLVEVGQVRGSPPPLRKKAVGVLGLEPMSSVVILGVRITSSPWIPGATSSSTSPPTSSENSTPGTGRPIDGHSAGDFISS